MSSTLLSFPTNGVFATRSPISTPHFGGSFVMGSITGAAMTALADFAEVEQDFSEDESPAEAAQMKLRLASAVRGVVLTVMRRQYVPLLDESRGKDGK